MNQEQVRAGSSSSEQTFRAREIKEALALVRRELGPDAIIVSTRRVPGRAMGLLGGSLIEVAARPSEPPPPRTRSTRGTADVTPLATASAANRHKAMLALERARRMKARPRPSLGDAITSSPAASLAAATSGRARSAKHAGLRRRLLASLVPRELAERWLSKLPKGAGEAELRRRLVSALGTPAPLLHAGSRIAALVGPTGAGKTTTIAKLAAHASLVERKKVALVSLDDHRIGAISQLRAYAGLLEVELVACPGTDSLARALAGLRDAELVLIDTAGVAPNDTPAIASLARRLERAGEEVTVQLCVPAYTRQEELDRLVHVYASTNPHALIATKVDEAIAIGSLFSAHEEAALPFSHITTGQRVPEDLEQAHPESLVDLLLGGDARK